jgi:hypothetical protein
MPNVTAAPFIVQKPLIRLGSTGAFTEIQCAATNLSVTPAQDDNTVETFCGSYTSYKKTKWTITVTIALSYGTAGAWDNIHALANTVTNFAITPDIAAPSVANPVMAGSVYVADIAFIDAAPGEASEVDLVLAVQGTPVWSTTLPSILEADAETAAA